MNNLFQACSGPVGPKGEKGNVYNDAAIVSEVQSLETKVETLETSMNSVENNIEEVDKLSLVNSYVSGSKNVAYTFTVGFNNMTTSQLESTLEAQRGYVDDSMRLGAVFVGFYWNSSYTICSGLFILPNNFSYTQKKVNIQATWGTQLFTSANFNPSITRVYNYDISSSEWSSWESNLGTDEIRSDVYSRLNTKITINDLQGMYHSVVPNFFPVEEKVSTLENTTNIGLLDGHFSLVINQVGVLFCDYFKLQDGVLTLKRYRPNANTTPSRIDIVWWLNTDNAKLEHDISLIYVGKTADGYEYTSEWNDNINPTEISNTLALKMDKIVLNPETLKNHAYDKEWLIKKTTTGWNAEKPLYLANDANTTLWPGNGGIDVSFTVYAEQSVTINGVTGPRYQVQGIPLFTRFVLIKNGLDKFSHNLINNLNKDVNKKVGTLETSMNLVETNALKLYKEQKTKEIFHLGQKIAENISSYDDDNYSITYLRGLLPNNDKKVTLKQSNLRSNFKTPLNTLPIFASSNLVIAEIINQHIVDEPEDIEVDAEQSELILMAANTITVETGEERNSTYKYWPQVYYNNVDTAGYEVFEAEEITGLNKQYALWEIWPNAYTTDSDNFYTKTFGLTPEKNSKMELDYNNGKFLFNSMVGGNIPDDFLTFLSYGSNTLFYRMPDGNTIYLFGNYWKNLNHQRTIQQPYLDIVKNHGFEIAVRLQLKTDDNETVIWTGQELSPYGKPNILFGSPDTDFETPSFLEVQEGDGTPSEDTFTYKGKNYKLKPVSWLYETLYTDGVLDSFKVEEYIAEYIMQDKNGRPDQCMATVFRTAKKYESEFGSHETNDKITETKQISKNHHLEGFDVMSETDRKTAIDNFTLENITRVPQNLSWTTGPLKGFNVLALVKVVASVVPAMMMAALGATVTYVVDPTEINFPSFEVPLTATGKRVYLNLRHDNIDDRAIFEELLSKTHIFITNIKKPSMKRLGYDSDTIATQGYFGSKGGIYCEFTALGPGDSNEIYKGFADTTAQLNGLANQFFRSDNPTYEYAWSFYQDNVGAISLMVAAMDTLAKWKRRGGVWETRTSLSQSGNFFAKNLKEISSPYDWNENSDISSDLSALIEYHSKSLSDAGIANINSNFGDFSDIFKANEHFNNNHDKFETKDWVVSTQKVLPYRRKDTDNQLVFIGDIEIENQLIGNYITPEKAVHRFNANN